MPNFITARTVDLTEDKRGVASNGTYARLLEAGNTWNRIVIGFRYAFSGADRSQAGSVRLALGLSNGITNVFGEETTNNFCGLVTDEATLTYNAGGGFPFWDGVVATNADLVAATRVGTTLTTGSVVHQALLTLAASAGIRHAIFIDITKGSPNFTLNAGVPSSVGVEDTDITKAEFESFFDDYSADLDQIATWNLQWSKGSDQTIAVDEAGDGDLTAINFAWPMNAVKFECSDIMYAVLS